MPLLRRLLRVRAALALLQLLLVVTSLLDAVHAAQFPILVSLPLTGAGGTQDAAVSARQILEFSLDDVNQWAGGNHSFSLSFRDSRGSMSTAVDNVFVANRTGAVGIIGEMSSSPTTAMALSASQFQLWQCSGSVTNPDLSDKSNVPFFMRTIPSDTFQGRMLARFVHLVQWHTVALLFSSDSYGTNLMSTFTDEAAKRNITISTSQSFSSTDPRTHAPAIAAIKTAGTRVVLFFGTADQFVGLAREARAVSILGSDEWTWVGSDGLSGLVPLVADKTKYSNADRDLDGLLYAFPVEQGAAYAAFQARFAAKYPNAVIHRYAVLYRDCLFAMARGIVKLAGQLSPATVLKRAYPSSISLADFLDPFDGTSGAVTYDANGDRLGDYAIVNVYGGKEETVFTLPANGTKLVPSSAALKFYGGSSTIPSDVPKYRLGFPTWTSATGIVVMALTAIMIVVVVLTNLYLALNQHESSVKHMAMPFLTQISVGFVLLLSTVFLSIDVPMVGTCHAQVWTFVLGFELVISAVAAKTWRIWRVFDNAKLRKLAHLNNGRLFLGCLAIMAVQIVIMVVWTALAPVRPRKVFGSTTISYECAADNRVLATVLQAVSVAYNGALLLLVSVLAYKTRRAHSLFRESASILYTAQNVTLCGIVLAPFMFISKAEFALASWLIRSMTVLYAVAFAYAFLIGRIALGLVVAARARRQQQMRGAEAGGSGDLIDDDVSDTTGGFSAAAPLVGKPSTMTGKYPVRLTSRLFQPWITHRLTLFALESYLGMTRITTATERGKIFHLRSLQFDPNPATAPPLCIEIKAPGSVTYCIQFKTDDDKMTWVRALAVHCQVWTRGGKAPECGEFVGDGRVGGQYGGEGADSAGGGGRGTGKA
ncbi:hypothetical protein GGF32_005326 [Allomyces javanicus]|nr:hypothetical protein GGF32_005326 [Allomyces javanicus]